MIPQTRSLRQYQTDSMNSARSEVGRGFLSVLVQGVTGTGKTRMVGSAIDRAISKKIPGTDKYQTVWFVVPRKELLWQSSEEFYEWGIKHGMISANSKESAAFQVHICSRDTLIKRVRESKIRNFPNIIIFDEAHIALDQQLEIKKAAQARQEKTIFLGFTATPERLDGRGLNEMYETAVIGEQLSWFVANDYLKHPWVLSIPKSDRLEGLEKLKFNKAGDVSAKALNELYHARAEKQGIMYGDEIEHYRKFGSGRSFLVFCRSLGQCEDVAEEFTKQGFPVESIDGTMTDKVRKDKIGRVQAGKLMGLTTVDLCTYGLDVPKISCVILLRLTQSVALFFQMIGRGLRFDKEHKRCLILDHVGNCDEQNHGHPLAPRAWNFTGREKKEKKPKNAIEKLESVGKCPICYDILIDGVCRSCGALKEKNEKNPYKEVDGWLVEIKEPTPLKERPVENQRHYQDMINNNIDRFNKSWFPSDDNPGGVIDGEAVENLLTAAYELKRHPMWVYYELNRNQLTVNASLLTEIARVKNYKPFWVTMKRTELEEKAG